MSQLNEFMFEALACGDGRQDENWRRDAACGDMEPERFFPFESQAAEIRAAKAVCARCPVKDFCLDEALANGLDYGIWGGTTPRERRDLRARRLMGRAS
ncbi:WhiB family transcriptional regulator [Amycolatopsis sp. NPDC058986]|uniref:WhiB family transcriptional regulator n=1 Tax=unclassified Amycolatopsis TaxID=2618356 RepID=UPI00366D611E